MPSELSMKRRKYQLNELCDFQNGYSFKNPDYVESSRDAVVVFRMGNIAKGGGINHNCNNVFFPRKKITKNMERFFLKRNDIVICMTDMKASMNLLGHTAIIQTNDIYLQNQRVGRIRVKDKNVVNPIYLFYYTNSSDFINHIRSTAHSGVQVNLSTEEILQSPILLHPYDVQCKIAWILSNYDNLIQNNTRRILILEEMAQTIYREWFVHFRYPGHEPVPLVESELGMIPQGWGVDRVASFGRIITGKTPSKSDPKNFGDYLPFIKIPDLYQQIYPLEVGEYLSQKGADTQKNKTLPLDSICVSCIGTAGLVGIIPFESQTNQQINTIVLENLLFREFLYFSLVGLREKINMYGSNGVTMVNLNKEKFGNLTVLLPPANIVETYHDYSYPMFEEILVLAKSNINLRQQRDLLLPRLVSGELDVCVEERNGGN